MKIHGAVSCMSILPTGHGSGHAHGEGSRARNSLHTRRLKEFRCSQLPCPTTGIESRDLAALTIVKNSEGVAANTIHMWSYHGQDPGHGDDGVGSIATLLQDPQACLRRQRMIGRHRAFHASHVRPVLGGIGRGTDVGRASSEILLCGGAAHAQGNHGCDCNPADARAR